VSPVRITRHRAPRWCNGSRRDSALCRGSALERRRRGSRLGTWLLLTAACTAAKPVEQPSATRGPSVAERAIEPAQEKHLYAADEALRDVLSGELQYLGTARWPGVERSQACAFRNDRVLVVNVYCTLNETPAFRLEVYSPERGRVRMYAEANGPVSLRNHRDYFIFMTESGRPPDRNTSIRPLTLNMSFEELRAYERMRYDARLPGCYGGEQFREEVSGCIGANGPIESQWAERNRAFLEHPNDDWYRVIGRMRTLAALYGKHRNDDPD
jgi:hypothetical protein